MKYVSITFDDGRADNFSVAFPILKENGFAATVFCTTGYIDGTWKKKDDWYSAEEPLSIDQLVCLQKCGWEIALHGDKHITEITDTDRAIEKFEKWGLMTKKTGMSLPDSRNEENIEDIIRKYYPDKIMYIRGGRTRNTKTFTSKVLFGLYTYLKSQIAYDIFNNPNVYEIEKDHSLVVPSIVIRLEDKPQMVFQFINKVKDGTWITLMLHSIHPDNKIYRNDPWNWQESNFRTLCKKLKELEEQGKTSVLPMIEVAKELYKNKYDEEKGNADD